MLSEHVSLHQFHGSEPHWTGTAGELVVAFSPLVVVSQGLGTDNPPATVVTASLVAETKVGL